MFIKPNIHTYMYNNYQLGKEKSARKTNYRNRNWRVQDRSSRASRME